MDCFVASLLAMTTSLPLAGCGSGEAPANGSADTNQIERLARPKVEEKADPIATARLQPLSLEDLEQAGMHGAACTFRRDDVLLLAAVGSDALVRIAGELRHLVHSAPVSETGGFFEDRQIAISVGRLEEGAGVAADGAWPGRLKVINRRTEAELELRGTWACRGQREG